MRYRVLRTALTLLLSATVFLGSMIPPAVQHAHGEEVDGHHHKWTLTNNWETIPTWHRHVTLLGWDFQLSASDCPNGSSPRPGDLSDHFETLVRLFETNFVFEPAPRLNWVGAGHPLMMDCATMEYDCVISPIGRDVLASLPLCDTARGERSGIQLV